MPQKHKPLSKTKNKMTDKKIRNKKNCPVYKTEQFFISLTN